MIGRQASEEGQLGQDAEISRQHARIARSSGAFTIEDLGSTNGTFVNGRRISKPELLSPGRPDPGGRDDARGPGERPGRGGRRPLRTRTPRSSSHMITPPELPTEASPPPLSLHLSFDPAAGEVTLRLDDESDPVRLVYENGRWKLAPNDSPG